MRLAASSTTCASTLFRVRHCPGSRELSKLYGATYDRTQFSALVTRIIARFQRVHSQVPRSRFCGGFAHRRRGHAAVSTWTLVEQILASHPAVFGAGELTFLACIHPQLGDPRQF